LEEYLSWHQVCSHNSPQPNHASEIISTQALKAAITTAFIMMFNSENKSNSDLEDYFSFFKHQSEKQYLTARGTTTRFHPQYNLSSIQSLSESCFQQTFCMSWPFFLNILHFIKPDPIFYNQSQNPQQDFSIQLAVATCRLGSNGNGAAVLRLKNLFQVGYVTINLYTTRVIKAIYKMQSQLASWPTQEECQLASSNQLPLHWPLCFVLHHLHLLSLPLSFNVQFLIILLLASFTYAYI
ncbi:uncharacterized protein VP01_9289g1, partial [Puccinia sorghi]